MSLSLVGLTYKTFKKAHGRLFMKKAFFLLTSFSLCLSLGRKDNICYCRIKCIVIINVLCD